MTEFLKSFFVEKPDIKIDNKILTVANIITVFGILLTFLYTFMFLTEKWTIYIPVVLGLAISSDFFDGLSARIFNQHSFIGKELDPFRDRLIVITIIGNMLLADFSPLFGFLVFILIILETKAKILKNKQGHGPVHTLRKIRSGLQMIIGIIFTISYYWFSYDINVNYLILGMIMATILAILSYRK